MLQRLITTMIALLLVSNIASAEPRVPHPEIPKGNAEKCVEPTDVMRRNHMNFILHQRDDTVHKGIRTSKHSFKECINCHVVKDENQQAVNYKDERHFCNSCHTYAAVTIDCFDCHSSTPNSSANASSTPKHSERLAAGSAAEPHTGGE